MCKKIMWVLESDMVFLVKKSIKRPIIRTEQTMPEIIYGFYDLYESKLKELGLLDKPSQIFNLYETSLCSDPSNTKVVSATNQPVFRQTAGTGRTNTSILFTISAKVTRCLHLSCIMQSTYGIFGCLRKLIQTLDMLLPYADE